MEWLYYSACLSCGACLGFLCRCAIDSLCDRFLGNRYSLGIIPINFLCGLALGILYDYVDKGEILGISSFLTMSSGFLAALTIWPVFHNRVAGSIFEMKDRNTAVAFLSSNIGLFLSIFLGMWLGKRF